MFDASHAALLEAGAESTDKIIRTHNGLIAMFGRELVQKGLFDASFGKSLITVQNFRLIADYEGDPPSLEDTVDALRLAQIFVTQVKTAVFPET